METTRSRAEWARITQNARQLARFKAGLERAEKIVKGEPRLNAEQLQAIELIFADARAELDREPLPGQLALFDLDESGDVT